MKQMPKSAKVVYQHLPILKVLTKTKNPRIREELLKLSPELIEAISSICQNVSKGNIPLKSKRLANKINLVKSDIEKFASSKTSHARKRKFLRLQNNQRGGGFFLPLIAGLLPTVASLVGKIFGTSSNKK